MYEKTFDSCGNSISKNDEHAKSIDLVMLWVVGVG